MTRKRTEMPDPDCRLCHGSGQVPGTDGDPDRCSCRTPFKLRAGTKKKPTVRKTNK